MSFLCNVVVGLLLIAFLYCTFCLCETNNKQVMNNGAYQTRKLATGQYAHEFSRLPSTESFAAEIVLPNMQHIKVTTIYVYRPICWEVTFSRYRFNCHFQLSTSLLFSHLSEPFASFFSALWLFHAFLCLVQMTFCSAHRPTKKK